MKTVSSNVLVAHESLVLVSWDRSNATKNAETAYLTLKKCQQALKDAELALDQAMTDLLLAK